MNNLHININEFYKTVKENETINESRNEMLNLWNNYMKLVDIIDGILSEHGELSDSYWKPNTETDLDQITSTVKNVKDINYNQQKIKDNFNNLIDGINGWLSAGHDITKYGNLSKINTSIFK